MKLTATQKRQVRRIVDISTELGVTIRGLLDRRHEKFAEAQAFKMQIDQLRRRVEGPGDPSRLAGVPGQHSGEDSLQEHRTILAELNEEVASIEARIDALKVNHGAAQRLADRVLRVSATQIPGFGGMGGIAGAESITRPAPTGAEPTPTPGATTQAQQATALSAGGWPVDPRTYAVPEDAANPLRADAQASDWITKGTVEE